MAHEADIIWILYQASDGGPIDFRKYPWDGPLGMNATLKEAHDILREFSNRDSQEKVIRETFYRVLYHLMTHGSDIQKTNPKRDLSWIGDKKPVQQCDPQIMPFMRTHFPNALYIHIIRNPKAAVASKIEAAKNWEEGVPDYWRGTALQILDRWAIHEEWVLKAKSIMGNRVQSLRLEDLCEEPVMQIKNLFNFLEVDGPEVVYGQLLKVLKPNPNLKYDLFHLPVSQRAKRIMEIYNYL